MKQHQDDALSQSLDQWALLNIECNLLAKLEWQQARAEGFIPTNSSILYEAWPIWVEHQKITGRLRSELNKVTTGNKLLEYWGTSKRFREPHHTCLVDWDATGEAMKALSLLQRRWITKHISGWCRVGKWMKIWKQQDTNQCPLCGESPEDARHVWKCQHVTTTTNWAGQLLKLRSWLRSTTSKRISEPILACIEAWRLDPHGYQTRPLVLPAGDLSFPGM